MISEDQQLRVQAWVDNELSPRDRRQLEAWLAQHPDARKWADHLRAVARCLAAYEIRHPLPESREFYWSKIARAIALEQAADDAVRTSAAHWGWRRWWLPAAAAATFVAVAALAFLRSLPDPQAPATLAVLGDIETPLREVSSFSFRAEAENMTVVWVNFQSQ